MLPFSVVMPSQKLEKTNFLKIVLLELKQNRLLDIDDKFFHDSFFKSLWSTFSVLKIYFL